MCPHRDVFVHCVDLSHKGRVVRLGDNSKTIPKNGPSPLPAPSMCQTSQQSSCPHKFCGELHQVVPLHQPTMRGASLLSQALRSRLMTSPAAPSSVNRFHRPPLLSTSTPASVHSNTRPIQFNTMIAQSHYVPRRLLNRLCFDRESTR
jgi:hypothetical protein